MTSLLVGCGLPGGMMGSMMADLGGTLWYQYVPQGEWKNLSSHFDELMVKLFKK